jgi:hypothetical protein
MRNGCKNPGSGRRAEPQQCLNRIRLGTEMGERLCNLLRRPGRARREKCEARAGIEGPGRLPVRAVAGCKHQTGTAFQRLVRYEIEQPSSVVACRPDVRRIRRPRPRSSVKRLTHQYASP